MQKQTGDDKREAMLTYLGAPRAASLIQQIEQIAPGSYLDEDERRMTEHLPHF